MDRIPTIGVAVSIVEEDVEAMLSAPDSRNPACRAALRMDCACAGDAVRM